jgi:hypothetical protein
MSSDLKLKIIKASLLHVKNSGFRHSTIGYGCHLLGLSPSSARLVEKGPVELVHNILDQAYIRSLDRVRHKRSKLIDEEIAHISSSIKPAGDSAPKEVQPTLFDEPVKTAILNQKLSNGDRIEQKATANSHEAISKKKLPYEADVNFPSLLKTGIDTYIDHISPYANYWDEAMALLAHPTNLPESLQLLSNFSDKLAYECGHNDLNVI